MKYYKLWSFWLAEIVAGVIPFGLAWIKGAEFVRGEAMFLTTLFSLVLMLLVWASSDA